MVKATLPRAATAAAAAAGVIDHRDPCLVTLGMAVAIPPSFSSSSSAFRSRSFPLVFSHRALFVRVSLHRLRAPRSR